MGDTGIQLWLFCCVTIICNFVYIKQKNRLSLILAQRMLKYQKIIKAAMPISELFLRPRLFGIVESSYYKDQWLGYDRYLWDKMPGQQLVVVLIVLSIGVGENYKRILNYEQCRQQL